MQRYLMNFATDKLPTENVDCLVVGSGVAGLVTAWHAAAQGLKVNLLVKDSLIDSNTNKAQGGIAAVFGDDDNFDLHIADTLVAGAGLCDEAVVRLVVEEGKAEVEHLIELGAMFDRDSQGKIALGREGCHCRNRVLHAKGDATGAEVVRSLIAAIKVQPNIKIIEHTYLVDLLTYYGRCQGAIVFSKKTNQLTVIRTGAVVLATGGVGRLYNHTTNPEGSTGSGTAIAFRAGAALMDMEFVQFHPTSLVLDGAPNFLISEAVRGAGGVLRNECGERFMPRYHELADLAPRDIVARAIYKEMRLAGKSHVYLDISGISADEVNHHFPMITATCLEYGLDIMKNSIPVAPAAHYMMGGIQVNNQGESSIHGLFACGEASCTGLHGANRLASNSLLEGLAFGRRVACCIAERKPVIEPNLQWHSNGLNETVAVEISRDELQEEMNAKLGLIRKATEIEDLLGFIQLKQHLVTGKAARSVDDLEYLNMLTVCQSIAMAALMRTESRGGHYRSDYPRQREIWLQHILQKR